MSTFQFSPSKKFLQLLAIQKIFIFTFGPSFKVNSYVEFIFFNTILLAVFFPRQVSPVSITLLSTISWWTSRSGGALSRGIGETGGR